MAWAQTPPVTPNIGLYLPAHGSYAWDSWYNLNWSTLDTGLGTLNTVVANVRMYGAKGDGSTNDTAAFQSAIAAGNTVLIPKGTYVVGCLTMRPFQRILGEGYGIAELHPATAGQTCMFQVSGTSLASPAYYEEIRNLAFRNTFSTSGMHAIVISYGAYVFVENNHIMSFDRGVTLNNSTYVYLKENKIEGSYGWNLFAQWTDTTHGPYFGTNLYIYNNSFDSGTMPAVNESVYLTDYATIRFVDNDIVGNPARGMTVTSANGVGGDLPTDITIQGSTFDSNVNEGLVVNAVRESTVSGNWFSSGRTNSKVGFRLSSSKGVSVDNNNAFWNGSDGMSFNDSFYLSVKGNHADSNNGIGLHCINTINSSFTGNTMLNALFNGQGAAQTWGLYEEATCVNNVYAGNIAINNTTGKFGFNGVNYTRVANNESTGNASTQAALESDYTTGSMGAFGVAAQTCNDSNQTATGALATDRVIGFSPPAAIGNLSVVVYVNGANTVTFHFCNATAGSLTPPAGAWTVRVAH